MARPRTGIPMASAASSQSEGATTDGDMQLSPSGGAARLKLLCCFGGRIHPRPFDGSLKYVGGETRVLALPRSVHFPEMKKKVEEMVKTEVAAIKYQLLSADADVLVSVACDEDLAHMRDEYDRLEATRWPPGSPHFRLYVFASPSTPPASPWSAAAASARRAGLVRHPQHLFPSHCNWCRPHIRPQCSPAFAPVPRPAGLAGYIQRCYY